MSNSDKKERKKLPRRRVKFDPFSPPFYIRLFANHFLLCLSMSVSVRLHLSLSVSSSFSSISVDVDVKKSQAYVKIVGFYRPSHSRPILTPGIQIYSQK